MLLAALCCGCSAHSVFLSAHALDTYQTMRGPAMTDGCFETDPITRRLIGAKPSVGGVLLWSMGVVVGYELLRRELAPAWQRRLDWTAAALKTWQVIENSQSVECR